VTCSYEDQTLFFSGHIPRDLLEEKVRIRGSARGTTREFSAMKATSVELVCADRGLQNRGGTAPVGQTPTIEDMHIE